LGQSQEGNISTSKHNALKYYFANNAVQVSNNSGYSRSAPYSNYKTNITTQKL